MRAWLGEIDRTLWARSRVGLLLAAVAVAAAGAAFYLAVEASERSAGAADVRRLEDQIDALRGQLSSAAQLGGRALAAGSLAGRVGAEAARLSALVQGLQPKTTAAGGRTPSRAAGSAPTGGGGSGSGAANGSGPNRNSSNAGTAVSVTSIPRLGEVIVNSSGLTLYDFRKDRGGKSACYGSCASIWPPLTTRGAAQATGGAEASKLGTTRRTDGTIQVTYDGHPLYTYVGDRRRGEATGNGITEFGASWHALHPSGSEAG